MASVAIIGAGCSGLAAAHALHDTGYTVTLFEKSRDVGGRATTRQRSGFIYDHGAQYIKPGSPVSVSLITRRFSTPDLIDIPKPIWIFDGSGHIQEGDPQQNVEPKWNYRAGLITLAHHMVANLNIHPGTHIARLQHNSSGWQLFAASEESFGPFDFVLIAIPSNEAVELIQASSMDSTLSSSICTQLARATYHPLISVMLGYRPRPQPRPYYALVNTDKAHPISWLAWEHEKAPERAPADAGLLIAQMAPQYSKEHWNIPQEITIRDVAALVPALINEALPAPIFTDIQHWRYALPSQQADANTLNAIAIPAGLAFCGDAFTGGRVHLALEHGIMVAEQLINHKG